MPHEVLTFNASSNAYNGCDLGSVKKYYLYCHHYVYQTLSFSDVPIQIFEHLKMSHTEMAITYDVSFSVQYMSIYIASNSTLGMLIALT